MSGKGGGNDLSNVFDSIISQAAKLPADTGATRQYERRFQDASSALLIVADVSSSMAGTAGRRTKAALLNEALEHIGQTSPAARLIAFASWPQEIAPGMDFPSPAGSTALDKALEYAKPFRPARTLVISDGLPDDGQAALDIAETMTGRIDTIYCGPDTDAEAIAFMRRLARIGGGRCVVHDVVKAAKRDNAELVSAVRGLLPSSR